MGPVLVGSIMRHPRLRGAKEWNPVLQTTLNPKAYTLNATASPLRVGNPLALRLNATPLAPNMKHPTSTDSTVWKPGYVVGIFQS